MSDDHDALKKRERERPVEPPVIDVEPEVSEAVPDRGVQQEAAQEAGGRRSAGASLAARVMLGAVAAMVLLGLAAWALSATGYRFNRDDDRTAALLQRIEALEKGIGAAGEDITRIDAFAAELKSTLERISGETPRGLDEINSRIEDVESKLQSALAAIESAGQAASGDEAASREIEALRGSIEELNEKVAALAKAPPAPSPAPAPQESKNTELAAALTDLERVLEEGRPFAAELDRIAEISPGLAGLEELRPHAATGAASLADLSFRLQAMVDRETVQREPAAAGGEQGLWDGLRSRISGLVKIRDLDQARWIEGMTAAMRHLARGDSRQAVAVLQAIEGPVPEELKAWLTEAQARAAVDRAEQMLAEAVHKEASGPP